MTNLLLVACALLSAAVLGRYFFTNLRAEDGYEDELGFHYGPNPVQRVPWRRN